MPQLSLYLNETDMNDLRENAKRQGLTLSKYAARALSGQKMNNGWPDGYFESVIGSLSDPSYVVDDAGLDPALDDACDWRE